MYVYVHNMYIYIYVCVLIYIYIHIYIYTYIHTYVYIFLPLRQSCVSLSLCQAFPELRRALVQRPRQPARTAPRLRMLL